MKPHFLGRDAPLCWDYRHISTTSSEGPPRQPDHRSRVLAARHIYIPQDPISCSHLLRHAGDRDATIGIWQCRLFPLVFSIRNSHHFPPLRLVLVQLLAVSQIVSSQCYWLLWWKENCPVLLLKGFCLSPVAHLKRRLPLWISSFYFQKCMHHCQRLGGRSSIGKGSSANRVAEAIKSFAKIYW